MNALESYFRDDVIIKMLCQKRLSERQKRRAMSVGPDRQVDLQEGWDLSDVLPPRSQWADHRLRHRKGLHRYCVMFQSLLKAVEAGRKQTRRALWALRLNELILRIRSRALSLEGVVFRKPRIVPIPKGEHGGELRPIAVYSIEDRIIQSLIARYLRDAFDPAFDPASIAFRSFRGVVRPPQHHDTIAMILEVNERWGRDGLYVAEADLRSFFDCLDHDVARRCVANSVEHVRAICPDPEIDPRALKILDMYLGSYSFASNVRPLSDVPAFESSRHRPTNYSWPVEELTEFHPHLNDDNIGVPQGGGLSDLLANAVLNEADRAVRRVIDNAAAPVFYRRYLDDVILISPDKEACAKCFDTYCATVSSLKLPVHTPVQVLEYGPDYWRTKSKAPFRWAKPHNRGDVPWISFVGYDVRYDGLVRVRKSSIRKHRRQIVATIGKALARFSGRAALDSNRLETVVGFLRRIQKRLTRMVVGRASIGFTQPRPLPMSWTSGFRGLLHGRILQTQLRDLDRNLERQIRRAERRLGFRRPPVGFVKVTRFHRMIFRGSPFSYAGQFVSPQSSHEDKHDSE